MELAVPILPVEDLDVAKQFYVVAGHGREACVSLRVDDADQYYEEWRAKTSVKRAPRNESWGARTFDLSDPFGNTIFVIGPVT